MARGDLLCVLSWLIVVRLIEKERKRESKREQERENICMRERKCMCRSERERERVRIRHRVRPLSQGLSLPGDRPDLAFILKTNDGTSIGATQVRAIVSDKLLEIFKRLYRLCTAIRSVLPVRLSPLSISHFSISQSTSRPLVCKYSLCT